jgi:hypothetical protein
MRVRTVIGTAAVALICDLFPLAGQEARGTFLGRVSDPTGAVMVGARVDAINTATGVHYTSSTNGSGDYTVPYLLPRPV